MAHKEWCLRPGERLDTNEYLRSKNGLFYAVMQEDGNFVTYRGDWWESGQNTSMWNLFGLGRVRDHIHDYLISHVDGLPRSFSADMQTDSNFCINLRSQGGKVVWCTKEGRDWPEYGDNCWAAAFTNIHRGGTRRRARTCWSSAAIIRPGKPRSIRYVGTGNGCGVTVRRCALLRHLPDPRGR